MWSKVYIFVLVAAVVLLRKLWVFIFKWMIAMMALVAEEWGLAIHPFPKCVADMTNETKKIERLLHANGMIDKTESVSRVYSSGYISTEPDKNATSGTFSIDTIGLSGEEDTLKLFAKFQTGKHMPLWLQAIRAVVEPGVAREVDFYAKLSGKVPLQTPGLLYAGKNTTYNVICLFLEYIEATVVPDHKFCCIEDMQLMLTDVSKMHSAYVKIVNTDPSSSWIPASSGLQYCQFVKSLGMRGMNKDCIRVYTALENYFSARPVTLVHGDCRPGNMFFIGKRSASEPASKVIFADWEAVNVAPIAWDLTYAMTIGLEPSLRRTHEDQLIATYFSALKSHSPQELLMYDLKQLSQEVMLLKLVLFYISHTIIKGGYWSKQGNTENDAKAWVTRVQSSVLSVDTSTAAKLLGVNVDAVLQVQAVAAGLYDAH